MKEASTDPLYPCADRPEVPEGFYSRLCPHPAGDWEAFNESHLYALADTMMESKRELPDELNEKAGTPPSGYVYLGQFIDHDITRDTLTLNDPPPVGAGPDVGRTLNYRTPRLDLDLLYGKGPWAVPCIYEDDGLRLKLGPTGEVPGFPSTLNDLPRRADGSPIVMDPRSAENLIVAQLHVLFAKFHNCALQLLSPPEHSDLQPTGDTLFERTRRFVTWHYQWIVREDFLPKIVKLGILQDVKTNMFRLFRRPYTPCDYPAAIPVEFTAAAFRFGHSMVSQGYLLNRHIDSVTTPDLLSMAQTQLMADHVIDDWKRFFFHDSGHANLAEHIDTYIADALFELPTETTNVFRARSRSEQGSNRKPGEESLPYRTLKRGSRIRLPSGQEFIRSFNRQFQNLGIEFELPQSVADHEMCPGPEAQDVFNATGFARRTPLWYYLLREAEVEAKGEAGVESKKVPQTLGTVGSWIVAEVIQQILNADACSINNISWTPPKFQFGESSKQRSITNMPRLVDFVQDRRWNRV